MSGLPILGYSDHTERNVMLVNDNKIAEEKLLRLIDTLSLNGVDDPRWLAIARAHIEQGFMALNRAIFKPVRVTLEGDG